MLSRSGLQEGVTLVLLVMLHAGLTANPGESSSTWRLQREDIVEYTVMKVITVAGKFECLASAAGGAADAASFDAAAGACSLLACRLGGSGCRKCRNTNNPSLPLLWLRQQAVSCWQTFQHRVDGSVSFNRQWSDYVNGFGEGENLNYWMGLEQLHKVTNDGAWRVRWEFSDWNGTWYWAENANFAVADASDKYRARMGPLDSGRSSVGMRDEGDWTVDNQQFSTIDSDNDQLPGSSCAVINSAGWWFSRCTAINANAVYQVAPAALSCSHGIYYFWLSSGTVLTASYSMKTFECLIQQ